MDYKYIEQLLERYWVCETSLEEEEILRMFFSQKDVPAALQQYRRLFIYEQTERKLDVLGDDFDARVLELISEPATVKARTIRMPQRLMPLFKAAAIVAIILTLGNAMQVAFDGNGNSSVNMAGIQRATDGGPSVAFGDSVRIDTLQQSSATILK